MKSFCQVFMALWDSFAVWIVCSCISFQRWSYTSFSTKSIIYKHWCLLDYLPHIPLVVYADNPGNILYDFDSSCVPTNSLVSVAASERGCERREREDETVGCGWVLRSAEREDSWSGFSRLLMFREEIWLEDKEDVIPRVRTSQRVTHLEISLARAHFTVEVLF